MIRPAGCADRRRSVRGFTLLEMLVVIVLAGILVSIVTISVTPDPRQKLTREAERIRTFWADHEDVIVKPLDGMGGAGVFRLQPGDPNAGSILETVTAHGLRTAMAQKFIPAIRDGDKRVLVIDGVPVPYCLARVPKAGETRGNLAAGGIGRAQPLTERDREIASVVGQALLPRGLRLLGLDVIGDYLTEINVTSPTCFVEIAQQAGCNVAGLFIDALERSE